MSEVMSEVIYKCPECGECKIPGLWWQKRCYTDQNNIIYQDIGLCPYCFAGWHGRLRRWGWEKWEREKKWEPKIYPKIDLKKLMHRTRKYCDHDPDAQHDHDRDNPTIKDQDQDFEEAANLGATWSALYFLNHYSTCLEDKKKGDKDE